MVCVRIPSQEIRRVTLSLLVEVGNVSVMGLASNPIIHTAGVWTRSQVKHALRPRLIRAYLDANEIRLLKIGAGRHATPGWLCTDINPRWPGVVYMDATNPWPLPSDTFAAIACEHMIEHVPHEGGQVLLRESRRTLMPGGTLRISTPNIDLVRDLLLDKEREYAGWSNRTFGDVSEGSNPVFTVNRMMRLWGHTFIYDEATLTADLRLAGFTKIVKCHPGESEHVELVGIDRHAEDIGEEYNRAESLILEAT
jgi:predicted SAM-dependent methyltransferase